MAVFFICMVMNKIFKRNLIKVIVLTIIIFVIVGYALFQISKSRTFQFFGELIPRVETSEKVVALTFDDGPTEYTSEVIKILEEKGIKATFFLIGENLEALPQIGKRLVNAGHQIGNHSYSHQRFLLKSQKFIDEEIQKTNQLIQETGFNGPIYFRPPTGKKLFGLPWYLSQHQIKTIMWDVEPDTFAPTPDPKKGSEDSDFLIRYTLENVKPGSIILLHPHCTSCTGDRSAIGSIIDGLQAKGYRFVTIEELLKY